MFNLTGGMFRGGTSKKNHAAANMVSAPPANPRGTRFAGGMGSDQAFVRKMVLVLVVLLLKDLATQRVQCCHYSSLSALTFNL